MLVLKASNPDAGLSSALPALLSHGVQKSSRNGPVLRIPTPATMIWTHPTRRVAFNPIRDANPFFHLFEALWMLAGRNSVAPLAHFAKQIASYSDDGESLNAAYGHRWRVHFGHDQIQESIEILRADPDSRQVVVQIWDHNDLVSTTKDRACNTQALFEIQDCRLNMTVFNRSNDVIWGMTGANVVHFSVLQEYVANRVGVEVGTYYQISNNLHLYTDFEISQRFIDPIADGGFSLKPTGVLDYPDYYVTREVGHYPLHADRPEFDEEVSDLVDHFSYQRPLELHNPFLNDVADPMRFAYAVWKAGDRSGALSCLSEADRRFADTNAYCNDWLTAGCEWMSRRINKESK